MKENKALKIIFSIIVIVFFVHQIYSSLYNPVTTQNAEFFTATEGVTTNATVIRQEVVITNDIAGTLHYKIENGNRIAKGGTVADIYDNETASFTVNRLEALNKKLSDIQEISGYNDVAAADIELLNERLRNSLNNFVMSCSGNNFSSANETADEFLSAVNRKQFVTDETIDFSAQLTSLSSEIASVSAALSNPKASIRADRSGYFISQVDGYENTLSCDNIGAVTPEMLDEIKPEEIPNNAIGKIVSDYDWYIAATVSLNDSFKYKEGDSLQIKTSLRNNPVLNVTVKQINVSNKQDKATVIFSCQEMNSDLATMRSGNITIINKEYSGLKVSKKALRVVGGKTGVYVVSGLNIKYVKVNVLYSNDEYIICEKVDENNKSVLRLYDEVVVKGKNLYDGKIIN